MTRLEEAVSRLSSDLGALGVRWALIGGLAVSAVAEPRTTNDVDVVIAVDEDSQAEGLVRQLQDRGYRVLPNGVHERRDRRQLALVQCQSPVEAEGGIRIDLFFGWSLIEREIASDAPIYQVEGGLQAPIALVGDLLALKLQAWRPRDQDDALALVREATEEDLGRARASLLLMRERGSDDGRDLLGELQRLLERRDEPRL